MSALVIDLCARRHAARVAVETAAQNAATDSRWVARRETMARDLGGTVGAEIVATVATDMERREAESRYMPAYCDPANETRGSKYDATRGATSTQLAAFIRADIKAAQKRGDIPAACKISTRQRSYAGGYSIDVEVTALPDGFRVTSPAFARYAGQHPNDYRPPFSNDDQKSEELRSLIGCLESIAAAYNRDNSDSMVDYFDRRFYGSVGIDWQVRDALQAAEIAAAGEGLA